MAESVYTGSNFTGVVNSLSASTGQIVRTENFDCTVDQNGSTFFFGFLTKYPKSTAVGDTIATANSLGLYLFLPQSFSDDGDYRYMQAFTDGTVRYYDTGTSTWVSIGTGYSVDYHRDFETFSTRDIVYSVNGIDTPFKWRMDWTAVQDLRDKGGTPTNLTGTLGYVDDSTAVTGVGTLFLTELTPGDYIRRDDTEEYFEVFEIIDDENLNLYTKYAGVTGAGVLGASQKAPKASVNGRYLKIWKDRLILIGATACYFLLCETGFFLLQETGKKICL